MSANFAPRAFRKPEINMRIDAFLADATSKLQSVEIKTARLDALLLLEFVLGRDRSLLLAHSDEPLTPDQESTLLQLLERRLKHEPLAYILGRQEFYGHNFIVTPDVLIPRPETEALLEILRSLNPASARKLLDVGTGSGAIAISAKLEWSQLQVTASDISEASLEIARENANSLGAEITFTKSDLLSNISSKFDFIIANLPYVDPLWKRSPETNYEPSLALFAESEGLALIAELIAQAPEHLAKNGYLLLEADPRQHAQITHVASPNFRVIRMQDFAICLQKSTENTPRA